MNYFNVNGRLVEGTDVGIGPGNQAFRYGYGLFETMLVQHGEIQLAQYHWERLLAGAKHLYFELPALMTSELLLSEVTRTVTKNKLENLCRVRLQLYGGEGGLYDGDNKAGYVIECFPLNESLLKLNEAGLTLGIAEGLRKSSDSLANFKTTSALIYAIAAKQAKSNKWNDALLRNTAGNIIESTIANIFWMKDGKLFTVPLSDGCVAGVMRRYILSQADVTEASLSDEKLQQAEAVFLTNAIRRIKWVKSIGATQFEIGYIPDIHKKLFS